MTMISRVLGFVRDMVLARMFGADAATDAFFLAFKIPNFLRRLFAEGAFSQAFVPVFTEYKETKERAELKLLLDQVAGTFSIVLLGITLAGVIAAPLLIMLFGPGFMDEPQQYQLAVDMLRITFPYLFFIALVAFAGGIFNSFNQFAVPALTPVFLNIVFIAMAVWASPLFEQPVMALAWAVFIAGVVQLLFQIPFLIKLKVMPRPRWGWKDPGVQKIKNLMLPAIFGSSVVQVNLLIDTLIASFLISGSISWLYYSDRLVEFPLGLLGIALATVILPKLSKDHATQSITEFSQTVDWALRFAFIIGLPATVGLVGLSSPLLVTLFYGGNFNAQDIAMSSLSLMAYSAGLMGFILIKVLAPAFYSRQDTKTPVKVGIQAMIANIILNALFVIPMVMSGFEGAHSGLALATSISAYINAGTLFYLLRKQNHFQIQIGWLKLSAQIVFASILMAACIYFLSPPVEQWLVMTSWQRVIELMLIIGTSIVCYTIALILSGFKPKSLLHAI